MFGLIIGMSIFSALSMNWARQELLRQQARNAQREHDQAVDISKAMEFSLLTETQGNYHETPDLSRAMGYTSTATGKTRGGDKVMVNVQQLDDNSFGAENQRVAVTASDDTLKRSQVYRAASADQLGELAAQKNAGVVTFDTSAIRARQMIVSVKGLEGIAEQVYAFYAGNLRFPSTSEYDQLARKFSFHDSWGRPFDYSTTDNDNAVLEFTTPWNYTYRQKLNLKNNNDAAQ